MGAYRLDETKELALYNWVSTTLGITTIWDKPNNKASDRPALPYATLNFLGGSRSEGPSEEIYKSDDTFTYPIRKVLTFSVQIFAENGYLEYADDLINSLSLPTIQDSLRVSGFAIRGHSDPLDISRLLDTKFEMRVAVDIFLAYEKDVDDVLGEIRRVSITEGSLSEDINMIGPFISDLDVDAT
ncbi:MAG TPA: hypothetical protein VMW42_07180 [Desulfatiglandales bacterium]|nr:hypothetical protein [Desulfatiglandales bacterium]